MKTICTLLLVMIGQLVFAQEKVEMADSMRENGKIYVIVVIILIVLSGMLAYLFLLDRKISRLEKEVRHKPTREG
jgi:K+-transporting ATPase A subunit